jgi:hypothetical protein
MQYPDIVNETPGGYTKNEYNRLYLAVGIIGQELAYQSISMGKFQIMGFNHIACGYSSAKSMFDDATKSEYTQLGMLVNFIKNTPELLMAFQTKDFETIARIYNGRNYKINHYAEHIREYYNDLKAIDV